MAESLRPDKVVETIEKLQRRVGERFPDASLIGVVGELGELARGTTRELRQLARPNLLIRALVVLLLLALAGLVALLPWKIKGLGLNEDLQYADLIGVLEPTLGAAFFLTAFVVFLTSIERNRKRARILESLYDYRALAHVLDMHQLTKDPQVFFHHEPTASSPKRNMTPFELGRYFDYCSEALALISKVSALYAERFPDQVVTTAVDEIEVLSSSLAEKVWQKTMLLQEQGRRPD